MKKKSHSGLKKRLKVRKSGTASFQKSGKKHLLANKSKRQKHSYPFGIPVSRTILNTVRQMTNKKVKK